MNTHVRMVALLVALGLWGPPWAMAQSPDTILVNGKVLTVDDQFSVREAVAVRDGKIVALGTSVDLRKLASPATRVIDLQGRTVIPGLIDSHLHAIRAALSFATEVNWIGAPSLADALERIRTAARTMKPGAWLIVAGGWNVQQFKENRRPTQAELVAAAPNNPVYVQLGYGWAMLTPAALKALNISSDADLPASGKLERDPNGQPTGGISGPQGAIIALFDRLPRPTFEEQVEGTKKFFRELNRLGLTGVVDPGGNNLGPEDYQAVFKVWRDRQMTVRVAYSLCGQTPGSELAELKALTSVLPMGFGDDMLRFNGLGERITVAMNNNEKPSAADTQQYHEIVRWAASRGMAITMHWSRDASVGHLLDLFERVNKEVPIAGLRWSIAHLNDASVHSLERMKTLGVGWTVQDAMVLRRRAVSAECRGRRGAAGAAGRDSPATGCRDWCRHRCPPGGVLQPIHRVAVVPRWQDCRGCRAARSRGNAKPGGRAPLLHARQRVVFTRRAFAWDAGGWQARRHGRSVEGLPDGPGRPGWQHRVAAHDGRRESGVRGRPLSDRGGPSVTTSLP